eukprot:3023950-Rhodomonas_salina.1
MCIRDSLPPALWRIFAPCLLSLRHLLHFRHRLQFHVVGIDADGAERGGWLQSLLVHRRVHVVWWEMTLAGRRGAGGGGAG